MELVKQDLRTILDYYPLKPKVAEETKGVFKVATKEGIKCLKPSKKNFDRTLFICAGMKHACQQGFTNMPPLTFTKDGSTVVLYKGIPFYLTEWLEGEQPNTKNIEHIVLAAKTLAKFHRFSEGFSLGKEDMRIKWGRWKKKLSLQKRAIRQFYKVAKERKKKTDFDEIYLQAYPWILKQAEKASKKMNSKQYERLVRKDKKKRCLCHGNVATRNFILKDGEMYIIDFDAMMLESRIFDLWKFLKRVLPEHHWDFSVAEKIIGGYHDENPLEKEEIYVLYALLTFPDKLCRIAKKYYSSGRQEEGEGKYTRKFAELYQQRNSIEAFLKQYKETYKKSIE